MATPTKSQLNLHAVIGVIICMLGVLFTLDNLHLIDAHNLLQYWPLAPIGVGLLILMQASETAEWIKGTVWMAIGGLFLARSMGVLPFNPWALWPLFLVLLGVRMMWQPKPMDCDGWQSRRAERLQRRRQRWTDRMGRGRAPWDPRVDPGSGFEHDDPGTPGDTSPHDPGSSWTHNPYSSFTSGETGGSATVEPPPIPNLGGSASDPDADAEARGGYTGGARPFDAGGRVTLFALMSGVTRKFKGVFRGGQLTAIMGGLELDLRGAQVQDVAIIDTLAFWGGIEIFVPEDWSVVNEGFAFMGGFDDQTHSQPPGNRPHLIVRGLALMGGVEIKIKKKDNWWRGK
jgi:predicted membrane protein